MKKRLLSLVFAGMISMMNCKPDAECPGCQNAGVCVSERCECPPGFTGSACEIENRPQKISIVILKLTRAPERKPDGSSWDVWDAWPDVYLTIGQGATTLLTTEKYDNTTAGAQWVVDVDINEVETPLIIRAWDDDGVLSPDYVGGLEGKIWSPGAGFQQKIQLDCETCPVAFEATVLYEH